MQRLIPFFFAVVCGCRGNRDAPVEMAHKQASPIQSEILIGAIDPRLDDVILEHQKFLAEHIEKLKLQSIVKGRKLSDLYNGEIQLLNLELQNAFQTITGFSSVGIFESNCDPEGKVVYVTFIRPENASLMFSVIQYKESSDWNGMGREIELLCSTYLKPGRELPNCVTYIPGNIFDHNGTVTNVVITKRLCELGFIEQK